MLSLPPVFRELSSLGSKSKSKGVAGRRGRKTEPKGVVRRRGRKAWPEGVVGKLALRFDPIRLSLAVPWCAKSQNLTVTVRVGYLEEVTTFWWFSRGA